MSSTHPRVFIKKAPSGAVLQAPKANPPAPVTIAATETVETTAGGSIILTPVLTSTEGTAPGQFVTTVARPPAVQETPAVSYRVIHLQPDGIGQGNTPLVQQTTVAEESRTSGTATAAAQPIQIINLEHGNVDQQLPPPLTNNSQQRQAYATQTTGVGNTQILQSVDTATGQCYLLMTPDMLNNQRVATASKAPSIPQATFIPLSRLDGTGAATTVTQAIGNLIERDDSGKYQAKRRVSHNEVEKKRRDKINQWINRLAKMLPDYEMEEEGTARSMQSKGCILAKTVDFIQQLKDTNQQLATIGETLELASREQLDAIGLRMQVEQLTEENERLKRRLEDHGIAAEEESQAKRPRTSFTITVSTNDPGRSVAMSDNKS